MTENSTEQTELEPAIVCIGCTRVIPEFSDFCPHCGAPVGATAWVDPIKQIYAGGYVNRRFTSGTPSKWTMIVEIIIGVVLLPVNIGLVLHAKSIGDAISISLVLAISAAFYYRLVTNYLRVYRTKNKDCPTRTPEKADRRLVDPRH